MEKTIRIWSLPIALVLIATMASAQDQTRISPALALARICVSEAGWECFDTQDGLAIHEVLLSGASRHNMSYVSFARAYAGRVMGVRPHNSERLRWVGALREDGNQPSNWPTMVTRRVGGVIRVDSMPPWSSYRARWLAVLARAREVVRLSLEDRVDWSPCPEEVHDWGGAMDRERANRAGLIEVECGETSNDFYQRPSIMADRE